MEAPPRSYTHPGRYPERCLKDGVKVAWLSGSLSFRVCVSACLAWSACVVFVSAWCCRPVLLSGLVVLPGLFRSSSGLVFFLFSEKGRRPKDRSSDRYLTLLLVYIRMVRCGRGIGETSIYFGSSLLHLIIPSCFLPSCYHHPLMLCSFTNQVLPQLDFLRYWKENGLQN